MPKRRASNELMRVAPCVDSKAITQSSNYIPKGLRIDTEISLETSFKACPITWMKGVPGLFFKKRLVIIVKPGAAMEDMSGKFWVNSRRPLKEQERGSSNCLVNLLCLAGNNSKDECGKRRCPAYVFVSRAAHAVRTAH